MTIRAVAIAVAGLILSSCSGSPSGSVSPEPTVALSSPAASPVQAAPAQKEGNSQTTGRTPSVPPVGSPERKQILDTLREELQPSLNGREVLFKVIQLDVLDGWAFVRAQPQQPGGIPMDYRGTEFQRDFESGAFEDQVVALLRREADNWQVTTWGIGGTDVYWLDWDKTYGAPSEIFRPF